MTLVENLVLIRKKMDNCENKKLDVISFVLRWQVLPC